MKGSPLYHPLPSAFNAVGHLHPTCPARCARQEEAGVPDDRVEVKVAKAEPALQVASEPSASKAKIG